MNFIDELMLINRQKNNLYKWDTDFMHLFDLPEVELQEIKYGDGLNFSNVTYINTLLNYQENGQLIIPYVKIITGRDIQIRFDFICEYSNIFLQGYGGGCSMYAQIKTKDLVHYDMTKLSKYIGYGKFNWNKYKNKKGIIDDSKKIQFLTDLIKYKTKNATSKH